MTQSGCFSGTLVGFVLLITSTKRVHRILFQDVDKMLEVEKRLPLRVKSEVKLIFRLDSGEQEEISGDEYTVFNWFVGRVAHKIVCTCGVSLWRASTIEDYYNRSVLCLDCKDERELDDAYLEPFENEDTRNQE